MSNYVVQWPSAAFYTPVLKKGEPTGEFTEHIVKRGGEVPDGVDEATISVLISSGGIVAVDADAMEARRARTARTGDGPPPENAAQAVWAQYAVSRGLDDDAAQALSRDELIRRYGTGSTTGSSTSS